jgi:hypothetical protein
VLYEYGTDTILEGMSEKTAYDLLQDLGEKELTRPKEDESNDTEGTESEEGVNVSVTSSPRGSLHPLDEVTSDLATSIGRH